jgi:hypothetical protein
MDINKMESFMEEHKELRGVVSFKYSCSSSQTPLFRKEGVFVQKYVVSERYMFKGFRYCYKTPKGRLSYKFSFSVVDAMRAFDAGALK